ncbi:MAG: DUF4254 domain-containing protein [Planctomycetes bacterium]|nr:DUF4254 domain-containing protein [Planctomycetota bacterium]
MQRAFATGNEWFAAGLTLFERDCPTGTLDELVVKLLYHNLQVWHFEDQGRAADDERVVEAWRGGMAHNKERNVAINAIDALFVPHYRQGAEVHSESIGAITDRLTILFLKWKNYLPRCARTAAAIAGHIEELIACLRTLQQRIARGQARCLRLPRIKLYLEESSLTESPDPTRR